MIETTGLADPAPVAQTFFVDERIVDRYKLDGIITVVDSKHIVQHLDDEKPDDVENEAWSKLHSQTESTEQDRLGRRRRNRRSSSRESKA